jgi:long-chain fatty acid transport protein
MVKKGIIFVLSSLLIGSAAWAGGWNNTLMGARAIALGAAFTGVADDASAIYYNPAGLVFQENRFNFSIDGFYVWPTHEYTTPTGTTIESKYNSSLPQIFLTYRTSEKLTLGLGMYVPFAGGGVDWKKEDLGVPLKSTLGIIAIVPTLSYQISDKLSLGFNLIYYRGILDLNTEIGGIGPIDTEESGSALSAGLGLMFRPSEKVGLGLSVRGPASMKLSGTTTLEYQGFRLNLDSETSFDLPWDIEFGLSYRFNENFLFATSVQYTMWSALDKVEKTIKNVPFLGNIEEEEEFKFKDILIWRNGIEYNFPIGLSLRLGVGMDRYASPAETLSVNNIDVDKFTILGGIGYKAGRIQLDAAYVYALGKERERKFTHFGIPLTEKYNLDCLILGLGITYSY